MGYNPSSNKPLASQSVSQVTTNNTGSTIPICTPVMITSTGMQTVDPTIEADMDAFAGLTRLSVSTGQPGEVVGSGIIEQCGLSYAPGTIVYISISGGVTNVKPSDGVGGFNEGDFIVRLGVVVQNATFPLLTDLIVAVQLMGQL
jgi:hypothetical protein